MFSVDSPCLSLCGARAWLEESPVSEDEGAAIVYGDAERLFRMIDVVPT